MTNTDNKFTITAKLDRIDTFTAKSGKVYRTLILVTEGQYSQTIPVKLLGRTAENTPDYPAGTLLHIEGRLGGRDVNGRCYGDNVADTIEVVGEVAQAKGAVPSGPAPGADSVPF
jgi:hypothetical protein